MALKGDILADSEFVFNFSTAPDALKLAALSIVPVALDVL